MLIGVSFNLKDKRVDKMLRSKGVNDSDIYYSPIKTWLMIWFLLLPSGWWLIYILASTVYGFILIPYLGISYLLNAHHSNSFALHHDQLIVVNPNFPFRRVTTIDLKDIKLVTIDATKRKWLRAFVLFGENYLLVTTKDHSRKFYCSGLELDGFDENWTEKTIEDLDTKLKEKGILTDLKLTS
jgi:hypothetical protein